MVARLSQENLHEGLVQGGRVLGHEVVDGLDVDVVNRLILVELGDCAEDLFEKGGENEDGFALELVAAREEVGKLHPDFLVLLPFGGVELDDEWAYGGHHEVEERDHRVRVAGNVD